MPIINVYINAEINNNAAIIICFARKISLFLIGNVEINPPKPSSASTRPLFKINGIKEKYTNKPKKGSGSKEPVAEVFLNEKADIMGKNIGNKKTISFPCSLDAIIKVLFM